MRQNSFYVYILTNKNNTTLYLGVTNDLTRRVSEHVSGKSRFTSRYKLKKLVYFEQYSDPVSAIRREKQLKAGSRQKKTDLIDIANPQWKDLREGVDMY